MVSSPDPRSLGESAWPDNWTRGAGTLHLEILEPATGAVWLAQRPITQTHAASLQLPEGFVVSGIGEAVADLAYFRRSPGATADAPLITREIDGIRFAYVARPGSPEPGFTGVLVIPVEKHHRVLYTAGRTLEIMDCGDGHDYVPLTANARRLDRDPSRARRPRVLPPGWSVRTIELDTDLVVDLPCPTRAAFFFASGDSFQGPVRLTRS